MVVAMALIQVAQYLLAILAIAIAFASGQFPMLAYVNSLILGAMLYLHVINIPLELNWSRSHYSRVLRRIAVYLLFTVAIYSVHYWKAGLFYNGTPDRSFLSAVYFSFTTWTTLGYGDITVAPQLRLVTSFEALTGMLTMAVFTAVVWLYCQERLGTAADEVKGRFRLELDSTFGVFREIDSEQAVLDRSIRARRLALNPCSACGNSTPDFEKFYNITGRLAPFADFVVICACGNHTKFSKNAYLAAHLWNRANKVRPKQPIDSCDNAMSERS